MIMTDKALNNNIDDILWRTREHVTATSSSFSRLFLFDTIRAFLEAVELIFKNKSLILITYYKRNPS